MFSKFLGAAKITTLETGALEVTYLGFIERFDSLAAALHWIAEVA